MTNVFKSCCTIFLMLLSANLFAQYNPDQPPIVPKAPNTATLGKFGDYQVGLFTGVPEINIPIYTIKTKSFEVPISLSYHASGIKLYDMPSWVGTGWALNAGGQISRNLVGIEDEQAHGFLTGEPIRPIDFDTQDPDDRAYVRYYVEGKRDIGADIFSYSFPGAGGKFFFNPDSSYKAVLVPFAPIIVTNTAALQQLKFKLFDASGNMYHFGDNFSELTVSSGMGTNNPYQTSAWMLEKMVSATKKDTIYFDYQSQYNVGPQERSDTWIVDDAVQHSGVFEQVNAGGVDCSVAPHPYDVNPGQQQNPTYSMNATFSFNHKEIKFSTGKVVFELDNTLRQDFGLTTSGKALKRIKVYELGPNGYNIIQTIVFHYSYFIDGVDNNSKRLRLDYLEYLNSNAVVVSKYNFEYNNTVALPAIEPTTMSKDFWGYYNGRSNTSLVPQMQVDYQAFLGTSPMTTVTIGSTNPIGREPDETNMQAAMLKKIIYPTGGFTEFEFEANRYKDVNNNIKLAGGLRVKTIKSFDGISPVPITKQYKYGVGESGFGRANFTEGLTYYMEERRHEYWAPPCDPDLGEPGFIPGIPRLWDKKRSRSFYSSSTLGMQPFDAASVVYTEVAEYAGDGTATLGKTVTTFRDQPDLIYEISSLSKPVMENRHYARGQMLSQKMYKKIVSGQMQMISQREMEYNAYYAQQVTRAGLAVKEHFIRDNMNDWPESFTLDDWFLNDYYIHTDDNYLVSETQYNYDQDDPSKFLKTITNYHYGHFAHQQPKSIVTTNSKGEEVVSERRFPADYIASGQTQTNNTILDNMLSKHMQTSVIEQWTRKTTGNLVLNGGLNTYKQLSSGFIVPDHLKRLEIGTPVNNYQPAAVVTGNLVADPRYKTMVQFPLYDSWGNVLEMQKENNIKETYLWGYNYQFPVAKLMDVNHTTASSLVDLNILNFPATDLSLRTHLSGLYSSLPTKMLSFYTYSPLRGMTSETDVNGKTNTYEYDSFNRLARIRDFNGNILKTFCYNYAGQIENCVDCPQGTLATWENTATPVRCKKAGLYNTGEVEQEQRDMNSCSPTSNQLRWVVVGFNSSVCPPACQLTCTGEDKKCVNNVCETGSKVYTQCEYNFSTGLFDNIYHYEFSDGSWSTNYTESTAWAACLGG